MSGRNWSQLPAAAVVGAIGASRSDLRHSRLSQRIDAWPIINRVERRAGAWSLDLRSLIVGLGDEGEPNTAEMKGDTR